MIGCVEGGKGWRFYDEESKIIFPSAIATFPFEKDTSTHDSALDSSKSKSPSKVTNQELPKKGSIQHIINALKLGDFTEEIKFDKQDVAANHALT